MATVAATVAPQPRPPAGLRRALRRSGRREQWRAALLVMPLFFFLLASFIVPIGAMLARAIVDSDVARILPRVSAELRALGRARIAAGCRVRRDGRRPARGARSRHARKRRTRLNYDVAGFRSLLVTSGRRVADATAASPRQALLDADPKWGERETWAAIRRAGGPATDFYLLAAVDLRRDADNAIAAAPANESVFRNVLGRTLWIAGVVTLACLALGYPVALFIARQPPQRAALFLFLVLLPFWTSLLVRTVAWVVLLQREGILNNLLLSLGIVHEPLRMIFNRFAVYVAMVHVLLPFMVLPLYAVMKAHLADVRARSGFAGRNAVHRVPPCLRAADVAGNRRGLPDGVHPGAGLLHHAGARRRRRRPDDQLLHRVLCEPDGQLGNGGGAVDHAARGNTRAVCRVRPDDRPRQDAAVMSTAPMPESRRTDTLR